MKVIVLDDPTLESRLSSLASAHNTNDDEMLTRVLNDYFRVPTFDDLPEHAQEQIQMPVELAAL